MGCFMFSAVFWGVIVVIVGLSIILRAFGIKIPVMSVMFGLLFVYIGMSILTGGFGCVKSRREPAAPIEIGHRSATICHLANIAMWLKRKLRWDPVAERFTGNDAEAANRLLARANRAPWAV